MQKKGKRHWMIMGMFFFAAVIFTLTGCGGSGKDEKLTLLGTVNQEEVFCEDAMTQLMIKQVEYEKQLEAFEQKFPEESLDMAKLEQNFREEAYNDFIRTILLSQKAKEAGEVLSTDRQKENESYADELLFKFSEEQKQIYHLSKEQIAVYLGKDAMAGIYFGAYSKDYDNFLKDYEKIKNESEISIDNAEWEKCLEYFKWKN